MGFFLIIAEQKRKKSILYFPFKKSGSRETNKKWNSLDDLERKAIVLLLLRQLKCNAIALLLRYYWKFARLSLSVARNRLGVNFINVPPAAMAPVDLRWSYWRTAKNVQRKSWAYFLDVQINKVGSNFVGETEWSQSIIAVSFALCAIRLVKLTQGQMRETWIKQFNCPILGSTGMALLKVFWQKKERQNKIYHEEN